jgi:outer membrane receptor protein involved in Fe transport
MRCKLFGSLYAAGAIAALACAMPVHAQASEEFEFSLPAQDLSESLRAVSRQTGRNIVASADVVRGRPAPALSGPLTAEEAVLRLLAGSGLEVRHVGDTLVIVPAGGGERPAPAELAGGAEEEADGAIIVTGTNLRGAPASSPMIAIGREDIDKAGVTSVEQLMRKLPQNSQGGVNQENFGITIPDQDVTDHGAGVNLRGLGQRATLVLLDGRRLAPSGYGAYVDVSLIPVSLIDRVEVLTDGASAIYGSDAVGGVVNFILRDRLEGLETTVQAGATTRGGGEQLLLSLASGADWNGGHGLLAYEFRGENEIRAGERDFTAGLGPDTFLTPRERRHSVLASVEQAMADGLTFEALGTYAHRTTERTYFGEPASLPVGAHAVADSVTLSGELTYEFGGGWRARMEGTYALSDTDQQQTQPGGVELANARDVRNEVLGGAVKIDGSLVELPAGAVRMALGGELRHEGYRDGFESSAFARTVKRASRDVGSLFGELSIPLVSSANRMPGAERLEVSAAGRFDDYSGTGSAFDPKIGVLWSPLVGLDLRASYGTSFRAPLLAEMGGIYDVFYAPAYLVYQDPAQAAPGSIVAVLQGSDPDIGPETSRTWSAGAEIAPAFAPGLTLSLNYYSVRFTDRIALPIRSIAVVGDPAFDPIVDSSPDLAELTEIIEGARQTFDVTGPGFSNGGATPADVDVLLDTRVSNTAETATDGIDLVVRYVFDLGANSFVLDANVTHVFAFDNRLTEASPVAQSRDRPFGSLSWRARAGVGWSRGPWAGNLAVNYAGGYEDDRRPLVVPVDSWTTFDLSLSYEFEQVAAGWLRGTRLSLYTENLFDAAPPPLLPEPGHISGLGYDPVNASGRGRFVSLQVRKSW